MTGVIIYGGSLACWQPLQAACLEKRPDAVVPLDDCRTESLLRHQVADLPHKLSNHLSHALRIGASTMSSPVDEPRLDLRDGRLVEGTRVGRFVILRDLDGQSHAVAAGAVAALCQTDGGTILMLPAGRMIHVPQDLGTILTWLDGRQ